MKKNLLLLIFLTLTTNAFAQLAPAYTDEQIVNAIYKAEGGEKAKPYYYGIRSVKCETKKECREICLRTVKNNRKRFTKTGRTGTTEFLRFLANRYCPVGKSNLSKAENKLNRYWLKNVLWFLENS